MDQTARQSLAAANETLASKGLRVLAAASGSLPASKFDPSSNLFHYLDGLRLDGMVGLLDPPEPEVRAAIKLCHRAGIAVKMITGDQQITAATIARELGIRGAVLSSAGLDALDDAELALEIDSIGVFARVTPEQKVRIVKALKSCGHIVANDRRWRQRCPGAEAR